MSSEESKLVTLSQGQLLAVLDPDPKRAEARYVELHRKLVRYFEWNRAMEPEDMAQEALKRPATTPARTAPDACCSIARA